MEGNAAVTLQFEDLAVKNTCISFKRVRIFISEKWVNVFLP